MVFHTGVCGTAGMELHGLSAAAASLSTPERDLNEHPFRDWRDALRFLFARAEEAPLLLVLDEFPELLIDCRELPGLLRAELDRHGGRPRLKLLLSGSSMRAIWGMQEYRAPLYGRFDMTLQLHPFRPHEVPAILTDLSGADRAVVYGVLGGIPLYLTMWDQSESIEANLSRPAAPSRDASVQRRQARPRHCTGVGTADRSSAHGHCPGPHPLPRNRRCGRHGPDAVALADRRRTPVLAGEAK